MSNNYVLDIQPGYRVEYMMRAGKDWVKATCTFEEAKRMLYGDVRQTDEIEGYPLTVDGKRFFPGYIEAQED